MCICEFQLFLHVRCVERSLLVKRQEEGRRKEKNSDEHGRMHREHELSHQEQTELTRNIPLNSSGIDGQGPTSRSTMLGLLFLSVFPRGWKTSRPLVP